jgi:hypothetical protein
MAENRGPQLAEIDYNVINRIKSNDDIDWCMSLELSTIILRHH